MVGEALTQLCTHFFLSFLYCRRVGKGGAHKSAENWNALCTHHFLIALFDFLQASG